ncbi:MAG: DUF1804 family protein [Candidatus Gastranaerophilaceae bacterium]
MKKQLLSETAEKLYIEKFMTLESIARQLNVNERTLRRWKADDNWDKKRSEYLKSNTTFHEDLYNFGRDLLKSIKTDMNNGEKVESARMYAVTKIISMLKNVKNYEDKRTNVKSMPETTKQEGLSEEVIREIEEKILGITYED